MRAQSLNAVRRLISGASASRGVSSSAPAAAGALSQVTVDGNLSGFLAELDRVVSSETCSAQELSDSAVSLAYLQANGDRKLWGKVFQKASSLSSTLDPASLSSIMWASTTANVGHYKTMFEFTAPFAAQMQKFTPTQLSLAVEGFGKSGVNDIELFDAVSKQVMSKLSDYKSSDLARILWGYAAAGVSDSALVKAVLGAASTKDMTFRECGQVLWAMAKTNKGDKATLDAVFKAAKKAKDMDSACDAAAFIWSCATLASSPGPELLASTAAAVKASAADLSPEQMVHTAWAFAVLGAKDAALHKALHEGACKAVDASPDALSMDVLAALYESSCMAGADAPLSPKVAAYVSSMYTLASATTAHLSTAEVKAASEDLATSVAAALGNKYRPDITAAAKSYAATAASLSVPLAVPLDVASTKICFEICQDGANSGAKVARSAVLAAKGYKSVFVPLADLSALPDAKAKATYVLNKMKADVPATAGKAAELLKDLEKPFNLYA